MEVGLNQSATQKWFWGWEERMDQQLPGGSLRRVFFIFEKLRCLETTTFFVLVGGFFTHPFEKYAQVKLDHETPRFGEKIKNS